MVKSPGGSSYLAPLKPENDDVASTAAKDFSFPVSYTHLTLPTKLEV